MIDSLATTRSCPTVLIHKRSTRTVPGAPSPVAVLFWFGRGWSEPRGSACLAEAFVQSGAAGTADAESGW